MRDAGATVKAFYDAANRRDMTAARTFLDPGRIFYGLFETCHGVDAYLAALHGPAFNHN